jgi:magnesium-protoporphyrin IX monomethyl ester (oxidative) cyclase
MNHEKKFVSLINPPQFFSKTQFAAGVIPPLGLMYLSAFLKSQGHRVEIIDSVVEQPENYYDIDGNISCRGMYIKDIVDCIKNDVKLIGVTNLFSFSFPIIRKLTQKIKSEFPAVPIVVGGAHPSATPVETIQEACIDYVIISEGEETLNELVNHLDDEEYLQKLDGICFKNKSGKIVFNPKTNFVKNLDSLPFPSRELIPLKKYYQVHEAHGPVKDRWTPILSSRGCPFKCTFCTQSIWNRCYRARSPKNVVDEIETCVKKYGITEFHFEDENLTLNKKRTIEICNEIQKRNLDIRWQTPNGIRASVTDKEMLRNMKAAGCFHITVAPESGSKRVLNEIIKKNQDLNKVKDVVEYASAIGLRTAAYFVIGLPGETSKEVNKSIQFACKLARIGLDEVAFSNFIPLPGSELYTKIVEKGNGKVDLKHLISIADLKTSVSWSEHISSRELQKLRNKAYFLFFFVKIVYHPIRFLKIILNVLTKNEELKTERTLITFLKRFKNTVFHQ